MNCLIIVPYQATSWREPHKLTAHTQTHKVVLFKLITRSSADTDAEMLCSWKNKRFSLLFLCSSYLHGHGAAKCPKAMKEPPEVSSPIGKRRKLQFPSVIPAPWNAGIVLVTAGFQSTLKCNWTLERQTEKGRHCQGQSLAWHAIATSGLIDLYKATPHCHSVSLI